MKQIFYSLIASISLLSACEFFKPKETKTAPALARVESKYLFSSDLDGLIPSNSSEEDSTQLADKYTDDWIKKQLMISKSMQNIDLNQAEIERKVLDYRYALIVHAYIKHYISENLNNEVIESEIETYYKSKSDNFLLKQSIIKCCYAQIPKTAPNLYRFKRQFRNFPEENQEEVEDYIQKFAVKSFLEDSVWIIFDDLAVNTPLENVANKDKFVKTTNFSETSNEEFTYLLNIKEFKISDEISPIEFIREDIKNIIINKRKIALKKELEERIYDEAKQQGIFEIY